MANQNLKYLDDANFETEIAQGVTLVDFYADWCGPCRMIAPILEEVASEMTGKASVAKLDIEGAQKTTAHYQVTSIPTLILFKNGQELKRIVGVRGREDLIEMVESVL